MQITRITAFALLLYAISPALTNSPPPTWYPHSPYTGYQGNIDEVHIGFGDWCTLDEGPHPGIDFGDPDQVNGTMIHSPGGPGDNVEWAGCCAVRLIFPLIPFLSFQQIPV